MSSIGILDSIIRSLSLTFVDADDPDTSVFSPGSVPSVPERTPSPPWPPSPLSATSSAPAACHCASLTLKASWEGTDEHAPLWHATPAWNDVWSESEIRKESCRRLCWSAMTLAAGHTIYASPGSRPTPGLFLTDPANVSIFDLIYSTVNIGT